MEGDPHRNVRLSCGRSLGSNYYQCSQTRKMSIGIAAETIGKRAEIDQISVPQRGESSTRTKNVKKTYQTRSAKRNTYKLSEGRSSPSEMKKTSVPDLSRNAKDVHRVHATGVTKEPVRTTKEKPRDGMLSHGKRDQKNDPPNGDQTFSPMAGGTSLQVNPPVIKIKENLRMKLHNILGTKTSTEMPSNKVCASEIEANVPDKPEAIFTTNKQSDVSQEVEGTSAVNSDEDLEDNQPSKLRQDSDTIESDSEDSPPHVKRKRPMAKTRPTSLKKKLSYENVDNGAFYLKEKNISAYFAATTGRRSIFKETKDDTESHMIRMTKLVVPLNDRTNIPQSPVSESKKDIQVEEISLCGGMISAFKAPHQVQPNGVKCKDPYSIPEPNEKNNLGNLRSPSTPKLKRNENCRQELPPIRDNIFYDLHSPKLVMNATPQVPSPSPGDQVNEITRQSFKCMLAARKICLDDLFKFENALEKSQFICGSKNFQDRTTESRHSVASTASHPMRKRDPESEPLMSGTEHSRSTAEELSANRDTPEVMVNSPEIAHDEEQVLHERKRVCVREADEDGQSGRSLSSFLNGTRSNGPSEYDQENGLDRGIAEFGYALERVKDKLVLSTKKKCSEILTSTTEEMYSKLQSVKSQVEKDVGKLTSLSRSRKKFLETRFKEQQEQLWVIQDKFIKEISRHLEVFSNTMESFRAESSELKGVIERQQAFHQERVLQVEKTIENHLSDAQRRMAAVHEGGRLKMLQLRTAIGECFKDGVFD